MFKAFILICAATLSHERCTFETAREVINAPRERTAEMCGFLAQSLMAKSLGIAPGEGEYPKIVCQIGEKVARR